MPELLKDSLFAPAHVAALADAVQNVYPAFDRAAFLARVYDGSWDARELKERMRHLTTTLRPLLPDDYRAALDVLRRAAPLLAGDCGFVPMVLSDFVEVYGVEDFDASLPALEQFTQLVSAEFAVRPFIVRDPPRMLAHMRTWAQHPAAAVRRLASEGSRPRLPWGMALSALKKDPTPLLPILDLLKQDESEDVRRSVANHLNDIAKDNPQVVIDVLRRWQAHDTPEMRALTRHALRTLVKQGHPDALALLGVPHGAQAQVCALTVTPADVPMGGTVTITFEVQSLSDAPQEVVIDYVLFHQHASGEQTPKVFKLAQRTLAPRETVRLSKRHSFRAITTRRYYPGAHAVAVQLNGVQSERCAFRLLAE